MLTGELNFIVILFILLFLTIVVNVNTSLHLLLTAELLWITLYTLVLTMGILLNNVNLVSLTFFFLILSAVEFGVGLVIILVQNIIFRSISLDDNNNNYLKFNHRFMNKVSINRYKFL